MRENIPPNLNNAVIEKNPNQVYNTHMEALPHQNEKRYTMTIDSKKIGTHIAALRKNTGLTQNELGERLGISYQAVSKWERGETVPDVGLLLDLAAILHTTVDNILSGGEKFMEYKGKITVADAREALMNLKRMGEILGEDNIIYSAAIDGINTKMNTTVTTAFENEKIFECFLTETILSCIRNGYYTDLTDIKNNIKHENFRNYIITYAGEHGIR